MAQTEVTISIGGRSFEVACQEGEEQFLHSAAALLDSEAQVLVDQIGRMPEGRMLLMAGLMLADKTAGLEERLREAQDKVDALQSELTAIEETPPPEPERVEVPVIPANVIDTLAELAARAESVADSVEEKTMADR
ncbi:cell division protein ZapA [Cognatishimia sp. F0-27]|uniref:cell division protein ZapA n=1 Tax=Cognatishimia sp. F0-27 TaxID=2816855 RepID=UPI001D0C39CD|nr:cell division protein ZapA [Cognatishimia sp. F0-27]MCC1493331.1 cell division protein ZapA [Cognatishimia sp. F0-27]